MAHHCGTAGAPDISGVPAARQGRRTSLANSLWRRVSDRARLFLESDQPLQLVCRRQELVKDIQKSATKETQQTPCGCQVIAPLPPGPEEALDLGQEKRIHSAPMKPDAIAAGSQTDLSSWAFHTEPSCSRRCQEWSGRGIIDGRLQVHNRPFLFGVPGRAPPVLIGKITGQALVS
jgi:hypothetical protein